MRKPLTNKDVIDWEALTSACEGIKLTLIDWETTIGLRWFPSVRDCFRHMWE